LLHALKSPEIIIEDFLQEKFCQRQFCEKNFPDEGFELPDFLEMVR